MRRRNCGRIYARTFLVIVIVSDFHAAFAVFPGVNAFQTVFRVVTVREVRGCRNCRVALIFGFCNISGNANRAKDVFPFYPAQSCIAVAENSSCSPVLH